MIGLYTVGALGPFAYKNRFAAYLEVGTADRDGAGDSGTEASAVGWMLSGGERCSQRRRRRGRRRERSLCLAEVLILPAVGAVARDTSRKVNWLALERWRLAVVSAGVLVMVTGWENGVAAIARA